MRQPGLVQLWLLASLVTFVQGSLKRPRPRIRPRVLRPRDTTYSANTLDETFAGTFGFPGQTTTIDPGVTYYLTGSGPHNIFGDIVNSGNLIVTQADLFLANNGLVDQPLVVNYATSGTSVDGDLTTNAGSLISLNDYGNNAVGSPSAYNWALYSMTNGGTIQWCGNGNAASGSTFNLACATGTCVNNGLITWEQYYNDRGIAFTWTVGTTATGVSAPVNNGAFRLINTDLQLSQDVTGTGCYVLGSNGTLSVLTGFSGVTTSTNNEVLAGQSIYFTTGTGGLFISPVVYAVQSQFGANLYGFGSGNYLAFTDALFVATPLTNTQPISYSGSTLTINFATGLSIKLNIGTGYSQSGFTTTLTPDLLRIPQAVVGVLYNNAAPASSPPAVCQVTYPVCANPASTVSANFATTIGASSAVSLPATATTSLGVTTTGISGSITPTAITGGGTTATGYVTITTISGTAAPFTTTVASPSGNAFGTVLVVDPAVYVTVTAESVGATAPVTYTVQPTGTAPGTVVVVEPLNTNTVTTTLPYTGTDIYTSAVTYSTAPATGTAPATVYVSLADAALATVTLPYSGSVTTTTTVIPPGGAQPTVEILTPTISRPATLSTTVGPNQCVCRPRTTCAV